MADPDDRPGADSPGLDAEAATDATADAVARIARLQRIAFGADASEAERHAAAAQLEQLRRAEADAAAARAALAAGRTTSPTLDGLPAGARESSTAFAPLAASTPRDVRGIRWAIAAGAVALALGLGIGWQLGDRSATPPIEAAATAGPAPNAPAAVPTAPGTVLLGETPMVGTHARPQVESDALDPDFVQRYRLDGGSARRLLSRPDGLVVYSALREQDVCVIASWTAGADDGAPACSTFDVVNRDGLRTTVMKDSTATTVRWRTDGTVELTPSDEQAAEAAEADAGSEDSE
ncbi:hypothetical protein JOE59_002897 [Agromyces cerinus]|uniref:hypothetical protein n=1 Tax=Agromyces cerinus TaxID=33878 RepID=UPI0019579BF2|nr:hypothetical protein [Agromyces cerinus]MBM7832192.1 hypothetical protein [Agromyces cerinus]